MRIFKSNVHLFNDFLIQWYFHKLHDLGNKFFSIAERVRKDEMKKIYNPHVNPHVPSEIFTGGSID